MLWSNLPYAFTSKKESDKHSRGVWPYTALFVPGLSVALVLVTNGFLHPFVGDRGAGAVLDGHLDVPDVFVQILL